MKAKFTALLLASLTATGLLRSPTYADELDELYYSEEVEPLFEAAHPLALQGNPKAQFYLGVVYWDTRFIQTNPDLAFMWAQISYANGERGDNERFIAQLLPFFTKSQQQRIFQAAALCIDSNYTECVPK